MARGADRLLPSTLRRPPGEETDLVIGFVGDAGSGKTTLLRQLQRDLAASAKEQAGQPLPLFVRLADFRGDSFDDFLTSELSTHDLKLADYLPNRLFLLLDGFNELTEKRRSGCRVGWRRLIRARR